MGQKLSLRLLVACSLSKRPVRSCIIPQTKQRRTCKVCVDRLLAPQDPPSPRASLFLKPSTSTRPPTSHDRRQRLSSRHPEDQSRCSAHVPQAAAAHPAKRTRSTARESRARGKATGAGQSRVLVCLESAGKVLRPARPDPGRLMGVGMIPIEIPQAKSTVAGCRYRSRSSSESRRPTGPGCRGVPLGLRCSDRRMGGRGTKPAGCGSGSFASSSAVEAWCSSLGQRRRLVRRWSTTVVANLAGCVGEAGTIRSYRRCSSGPRERPRT